MAIKLSFGCVAPRPVSHSWPKTRVLGICALLGLLLGSGCAAHQTVRTEPAQARERQSDTRAGLLACEACVCEDELADLSVVAVRTQQGAALEFTTTQPAARARVRTLAQQYNERAAASHGPDTSLGEDRTYRAQHRLEASQNMPAQQEGLHTLHDGRPGPRRYLAAADDGGVPATARVQEVANGLRIVFVPEHTGDLPLLREQVAREAALLARAKCTH
jgi:hypothetical protein